MAESRLARQLRLAKAKRDKANAPAKGAPAVDPLYGSAQQQAQSLYQPQSDALKSQLYSSGPWFEDYMTRSKAAQTASQNFAAPIVSQAQTLAGGIGAVGGALAPDSPEAQKAAQAGGNISALAKLGAQTLQSQAMATTDYFGGQQANAARTLPAIQAQLAQQQGALGSQIQGKAQELYRSNLNDERNWQIAKGTLNLNESNTAFDNTLAAGVNPLTGKPIPPDAPSASDQKTAADLAFFEKNGYYPPTGPPKPAATDKTGLTPAQKQAAKEKEATRVGRVREKSGAVVAKIQDAQGRWDTYKTRRVKTGQTKKVNGQDVDITRAANANDITQWLLADKFTSDQVRIALKLRAGKKLDGADIDTLHTLGVRIPRAWLPAPGKGVAGRPGNAPSGTPGQSRPT